MTSDYFAIQCSRMEVQLAEICSSQGMQLFSNFDYSLKIFVLFASKRYAHSLHRAACEEVWLAAYPLIMLQAHTLPCAVCEVGCE